MEQKRRGFGSVEHCVDEAIQGLKECVMVYKMANGECSKNRKM